MILSLAWLVAMACSLPALSQSVNSLTEEEKADGWVLLFNASDNVVDSHLAGSLYDMIAADPETVNPAGEWICSMFRNIKIREL